MAVGGEQNVGDGKDLVGGGVVGVGFSSLKSELAASREISAAEAMGRAVEKCLGLGRPAAAAAFCMFHFLLFCFSEFSGILCFFCGREAEWSEEDIQRGRVGITFQRGGF